MTDTICVFIDGDNVSSDHLETIMNEIKGYGRIISCKVYADWSEDNTKKWRVAAKNNGIESIQADRINGKNSTDIKMTVDIMNTLHEIKYVTLFYLVTSDSDYRHVIPMIKLKNKKVHCIGSSTANNSLKSMCDVYTNLNVLKTSHSNKKAKLLLDLDDITKNKFEEELEYLFDLNESFNLSLIKDRLLRKYQFDHREYGYASMRKFIENKFSYLINIEIDQGTCYVKRKI